MRERLGGGAPHLVCRRVGGDRSGIHDVAFEFLGHAGVLAPPRGRVGEGEGRGRGLLGEGEGRGRGADAVCERPSHLFHVVFG